MGEFGSGFRIVDVGAFEEALAVWRKHLPRVAPFYAMKANPDPAIVRAAVDAGLGFDCACVAEMEAAVAGGAEPGELLLGHPVKPVSELRALAGDPALGAVPVMFDTEEELAKMGEHHPDARLVLRLAVDDTGAASPMRDKFGAPPSQVQRLLEAARDMGFGVQGVSFHIGSGGTPRPVAMARALDAALDAAARGREAGHAVEMIDIGGGFPSAADPSFPELASVVAAVTDDSRDYAFVAEPGRFFAAPVETAVVRVIGVREAREGNETRRVWIDDGVYGTFSGRVFEGADYSHMVTAVEPKEEEEEATTVVGPTCDGLDVVVPSMSLSGSVGEGDWLVVGGVGAYGSATRTAFNFMGMEDGNRVVLNR